MSEELAKLRQAIASKRAVFVVGAGVSLSSVDAAHARTASWRGLLHDGVERAAREAEPKPSAQWTARMHAEVDSEDLDDLVGAAEKISNKLGAPSGGRFRAWLADAFAEMAPRDASLIEALAAHGALLATTNYDGLLEAVTGLPPVTWRERDAVEAVLKGDRRAILHLHGHFAQPESVILGVRSYQQIASDDHAQTVIRALCLTRTLVFVGFGAGLLDPNFAPFLRWAEEILRESTYPHYRLVPRGEKTSVPFLRDIFYGEHFTELAPFVRALGSRPASGGDGGPHLERPADRMLQAVLQSEGQTLIVKGDRYTGKSELLALARRGLGAQGVRTQLVDLAELRVQNDQTDEPEDFGRFVLAFARALERTERCTVGVDDVWNDRLLAPLGAQDKLATFVERGLLHAPLVLFLDHCDHLLERSFRDTFFSMLRAWHERVKHEPRRSPWGRLTRVMAHSVDATQLIRDPTRSPFNVGTRIDLGDFTRDELARLNELNRGPLAEGEVDELFDLVGGHPRLTQRAFRVLGSPAMSWRALKLIAARPDGPFADELAPLQARLAGDARLRGAMAQVLATSSCPDKQIFLALVSTGAVRGSRPEHATPRCRLIAEYLAPALA